MSSAAAALLRLPELVLRRAEGGLQRRRASFVDRVRELGRAAPPAGTTAWSEAVAVLACNLRRHGYRDPLVARALALMDIAERLEDDALLAARALLGGAVVECPDPQQRALSAAAAATVGALAGRAAQVAAASDEAAAEWCARFAPVHAAFGLTAAVVRRGQAFSERRAAYACDVVYASHRELALDALRDAQQLRGCGGTLELHAARIAGEPAAVLMRGLQYAIVDDAARVLVDDGRIAISLSRPVNRTQDLAALRAALAVAERLEEGRDFSLADGFAVRLTAPGRARAQADWAKAGGQPNAAPSWEMLRIALCAAHALERGREYEMREGRLVPAAEAASRPEFAALWEAGLRQMLELIEGCEVTPRIEVLGRSSYQRTFGRYAKLAALAPHAAQAEPAFRSVYGLWLLRAPQAAAPATATIHAAAGAKLAEIAALAAADVAAGRPVVVRVRSAQAAQAVTERLQKEGLAVQSLRPPAAASDATPPGLAVEPGTVAVLTCSAGAELGEYLRLCLRESDAPRVIFGEADDTARHTATLRATLAVVCPRAEISVQYALDDVAIVRYAGPAQGALARWRLRSGRPLHGAAAAALLRSVTRRAERAQRRGLLDARRAEAAQGSLVAYSGRPD